MWENVVEEVKKPPTTEVNVSFSSSIDRNIHILVFHPNLGVTKVLVGVEHQISIIRRWCREVIYRGDAIS